MAIPPDIKIRLEQLRNEMAARAEEQLRRQQAQQNAEKMSKQFAPGKAEGGSAPTMMEHLQRLRQMRNQSKWGNLPTTPAGYGVEIGYELAKRLTGGDPVRDLRDRIAKANRGHTVDTGSEPIDMPERQGIPRGVFERKAAGGQPSLDTMKLALNNQRMYSPLEKAAMAVPRTKGTPAEFMAEVSKQPGFRKDEVEDRRISLPEQKMTKEEFLGHLKNHPAPLLNERVLGGDDFYEQANNRADSAYGQSYDDLGLREQGLIDYDLENDYGYNPKPHYEDYALPGGDNYREVLLTLPKKGLTDRERDRMMWIEANARRGEISAKDAAQLEALKRKQQQGAQDYQSSHWEDHPNVLAHMRLSDRRGPNGEKILHVDEVQSDWHQQGRKEGYNDASGKLALNQEVERLAAKYGISPNEPNKLSKLRSVVDSDELGNLMDLNKSANTGVPDAPFKKNWHELALKHVLGEAARGGYHGIAITPGDVQAERYDLSKQIDQIKYIQNSDGTYDMSVRPKGGGRDTMFIGDKSLSGLSEQELEGIVGKEVAQKMVSGEGPQGGDNYRSLSGLDLQVGGEGMRGFYDKILPTFLNKLGKPHGAQVGTMPTIIKPAVTKREVVPPTPENPQRSFQHTVIQPAQTQDLHYFPITDSLRQQVKTEGLPQYQRGGVIYKAEGGNVQPTQAQMRLALQRVKPNPIEMKNIGIEEAPNMSPKMYVSPESVSQPRGMPSPGGVATPSGMPIGGIDLNRIQPGQQLMPQQQGQQPGQMPGQGPQGPQGPQGGLPGQQPPQQPPMQPQQPAPQGGSNILQMTPQGRALGALGGPQPPQRPRPQQPGPMGMAEGGRAKPKFAIAPPKEMPKAPDQFTPYDDQNPNMGSLSKAFDEAIAHHLSLSPEQRKENSIRASEAVGDIIGRTSSGKVKDLLGKNAKLLKSEKGKEEAVTLPDGRGIETTGLALSPAYREGKFDTCPNHHSCKAECLGKTSGNYFKLGGGPDLDAFKGPRLNSLLKTQAFLRDPHSFAVKLHDEIEDAKAIAAQNGNHLGMRLNVLSDINPRVHKSIIEAHPDVTFYDYTKNNTNPIASNHHYTYSSTGVSQPGVDNPHTNWKAMRRRLDQGDNVAMAFTHKDHLPEFVHDQETGKKYRVVDGDTHDFRPLDLQPEGQDGVIVGLKNKKATGKMQEAHVDSNGFFVHYDPQLKMDVSKKTGAPVYARDKNGNSIPQNRIVNIQPQTRGMIPVSNDDGEKV